MGEYMWVWLHVYELYFTTALGSHIERSLYTPCSHMYTASPPTTIKPQCHFSTIYTGIYSCCSTSCGLWLVGHGIYPPLYRWYRGHFHWKINSLLLLFILLYQTASANCWSSYCLCRFSFSRMACSWNHTAESFCRVISFTYQMHLSFFMSFVV